MLTTATITAILPNDDLRISFKPSVHETIESIVTRHVNCDVQVGSRVDVDWDRGCGITRILWPSLPSLTAVTAGHTIATTAAPPQQPIVTEAALPADQPVTATAVVLGIYPQGYLVEYMDGPLRGKQDTVLVATDARIEARIDRIRRDDVVTVRDPGNRARIVALHRGPAENEPSFGVRVRMALGLTTLDDDEVLAAIRDHKLLADCEREILAALGMSETHTMDDVVHEVAELRTELGLPADATWPEIVSAARDTEESWEAVQRERANLCKALGIAEGSSFAALLAEVTNITTLASTQSKAMREAVRDIRQWMGVRGEEIDETDLADDLALLQRELLRCSGAHKRGLSIVDALREVAAEAYASKVERSRTYFGAAVNDAISRYEVKFDGSTEPRSVVILVDAVKHTSAVMRELLAAIEGSHRPVPVKLRLRAPDGGCTVDFAASPVPGEEGWS